MVPGTNVRLGVVSGLIGTSFLGAAFSQTKLQTIERGATVQKAKDLGRFDRLVSRSGGRGRILSRDHRVLAADEGTFRLHVDFRKVPRSDGFLLELANAAGVAPGELLHLADCGDIKAGPKGQTWSKAVSDRERQAIELIKQDWRADGLSFVTSGQRRYPLGASAFGIVGMVRDGEPVCGLERSQDAKLCERRGEVRGMVDRQGRMMPMRSAPVGSPARDGQDLTLTIDTEIQQAAMEAVKAAVDENQGDSGVAVVIAPDTGDLMALVNYPSFDPYDSDGSHARVATNSYLNVATMSALEPGSTFKALTLAKALDDGKATMNDSFSCRGEMQMSGRVRIHCPDHHGRRAHGVISPTQAIAKSCNMAAAAWALRIGEEPFKRMLDDLGLLRKSHLGLPGEVAGWFNPQEPAKKLQLATFGFGQSLIVSPVALAGAFTALANHGVRMEPRLVQAVGGMQVPVAPGTRAFRADTADQVMGAMEAVFSSEGTAKRLNIPGYRLAGKTGTAQKLGTGSGYVSNFVGFVPAREPRAVVLVMVDHPRVKYYGADVAGPAFDRIARNVIDRLAIPPTESLASNKVQSKE